ncbi:hypothetical protein KY331_02560, partial [Candidatus Woesearchaeota archaeon]|nr:hypothetical protein [Candidatus Woesearchaeota archaeon]
IGILVLVGFLIYSPHLGYRFPIHLDEWVHLDWAVHTIDKEGYMEKNELFTRTKLPAHEVGFHVFLSEIFLMTGVDPVLNFRYLAAFSAIITAFLLFVIVVNITKNYYTGIFAMLFFGSLRSNLNILGNWFFVPFVFCFPLIYLFSFSTIKGIKNKKFLIISIFILFVMYFIHVQAAMLSSLVFIIYLTINYKKTKKNFKFLLIFGLILILVLFFYSSVFWKGSLLNFIKDILSALLFKGHGAGPGVNYSLIWFYGLVPFVLASLGIIKCMQKKEEKFWIVWIFLTAAFIFSFNLSKISILVNYRRLIYFTLIGLVPLSAIGLSAVLSYLKLKLKKKIKQKKILGIIILILILIIFISSYWSYYKIPGNLKIFYLIDESEYESIKWLEENHGSYNTVFAPKWLSETIYPISKNYVDHNKVKGSVNKKNEFFDGDCKTKLDIIKEFKIDFVFTEERIFCSKFLELSYNNSVFIYEYKNRNLTE